MKIKSCDFMGFYSPLKPKTNPRQTGLKKSTFIEHWTVDKKQWEGALTVTGAGRK